MNQSSGNRRVDASGKTKHDFVVADFFANLPAGLLDERTHRPIGRTAAGSVEKIFQNILAQRRMCDFRVKLESEQ